MNLVPIEHGGQRVLTNGGLKTTCRPMQSRAGGNGHSPEGQAGR